MYKFITTKCSSCGAVIYNLPEMEIINLKSNKLQCEDCNYNDSFKESGSEKVSNTTLKQIRYSA